MASEALRLVRTTGHSSIKNKMTRTHGASHYLLRNGRFITASVQLPQEHVFAYVTRDGVTIFALLSLDAERLLLKLIQQAVSTSHATSGTSRTSPTTGATRRTCRTTRRKVQTANTSPATRHDS